VIRQRCNSGAACRFSFVNDSAGTCCEGFTRFVVSDSRGQVCTTRALGGETFAVNRRRGKSLEKNFGIRKCAKVGLAFGTCGFQISKSIEDSAANGNMRSIADFSE
jgi:hypothetical protein